MIMAKANGKTNGATAVAVVQSGAMQAFDASKFSASVDNMSRVSAAAGRSEFLRMDKSGDWYFGVNDTPVDPEDPIYVDPMGSVHGWQCWADTDRPDVKAAALLGSEVVPGYEPLPEKPEKVPHTGREWAGMAGLSMLLDGHKLAYTTTALGGLDAVAAISTAMKEQFKIDPTRMVPVINLKSDWYTHKKWGKTYVPVFDIVDWVSAPPTAAGETIAKTAAKAIGKAKTAAKVPANRKAPLRRPAAR
jgi:hypothetical protein